MPYVYAAGDYYRAGGLRHSNYGAGGLFSFIGKAAKAVGGVIGGPIGAGLNLVGGALAPTPAAATPIPQLPIPMSFANIQQPGQVPVPGVKGTVQRLLPGGATGYFSRRHMNPGNAKAARRAIRRIDATRKLLKSIERQLPMRAAPRSRGSRGVITRSEASRALRS